MTRKRVVVGQSGISAGQMRDFWTKVEAGTIGFDNFQVFLERPRGFNLPTIGTIVRRVELDVVHIDSVEARVARGCYDGANGNITSENFPSRRIEDEKSVPVGLVKFDKTMTTAEVEQALAHYGEVCDMDDMLALGVQFPELQRKNLIVCLGASWVDPNGGRCVGCLSGGADWRDCSLHWDNPGGRWAPDCLFAVRLRK